MSDYATHIERDEEGLPARLGQVDPALPLALLQDVGAGILEIGEHLGALDPVADRAGSNEVEWRVVVGPSEGLDMIPARGELQEALFTFRGSEGHSIECGAAPEAAMILLGEDAKLVIGAGMLPQMLGLAHPNNGALFGSLLIHDEVTASHPTANDEGGFLALGAERPANADITVQSTLDCYFHLTTP